MHSFKTITWIFVLILLSSFVFALACSEQEDLYTFYDDADSGGFGENWTGTCGTSSYSTNYSFSGNASLQTLSESLSCSSNTFKHATGFIAWMNITKPSTTRRWINLNTTATKQNCSIGVKDTTNLWTGKGNTLDNSRTNAPIEANKEFQVMIQLNGSHCQFYTRNLTTDNWFSIANESMEAAQYDGLYISNEGAADTTEVVYFDDIGTFNFTRQGDCISDFNSSTNYTTPVNENTLMDIRLELYFDTESNASATLNYNNTEYTATLSNGTNNKNFTATITSANVTTDTNITFFFNYTVNGSTFTTAQETQLVSNVAIDNCSTYSVRAINFTILNVTTEVAGSIDGYFTTSNDNKEYNLTWGLGGNHSICINPDDIVFNLTGQLDYNSPGNSERNYYISEREINATTENINLVFDTGTTQVTFTVTDQDSEPVENVFINVQKFDVGTNTATTVQVIKTDDDGEAVGDIILNTQLYKFVLVFQGNVVFTSSETFILLTSHNFEIDLLSDYWDTYKSILNITCRTIYTNSTRRFSFEYTDTSGDVDEGCFKIVRRTLNGDTEINRTCISTTSGTINMDIPLPVGDNTYFGIGSVIIDGTTFACGDSSTAHFDEGWRDYGQEGLFYGFFLTLTLIMIGVWNPAVSIALMIISVVGLNVIGMFHLAWGVLAAFVIVGGLAMYRVSK